MISLFRDKLFSILERHSRTGLEPFGWGTRLAVLLLMIVFVGLGAVGFSALVNPNQFVDPEGLNLAGEWEFYNGSLKSSPIKVDVPKPLDGQIHGQLAQEYFYKRKVEIPELLFTCGEDLSVTLGSIKGKYSIWINGQHLATSVSPSNLANYSLPKEFLKNPKLNITVRVEKAETLFPGIVHLVPMQIGRTKFISHQVGHRFFQLAVKPIVPALFKGVIFLIFATLFFSMPIRREYFWFSIYALASSLSAISLWQYSPFYEDFYLRQRLIFTFSTLSLACVPLLTAEFCRLDRRLRAMAAVISCLVSVVPILSLVWIHGPAREQFLFQTVYGWAPTIVFVPCLMLVFACAWFVGGKIKLRHRMFQLLVFGSFLFGGLITQGSLGRELLQFKSFYFAEIVDVAVVIGLALSMVFDFKVTSMQWQRSKKSLPSMVARLTSAGLKNAVVEFQAVVLVVDVVGYTKMLITLNSEERDKYNSEVKRVASIAVQEFAGEKVSDTGDGAVFIWTFENSVDRSEMESRAMSAANRLNEISSSIRFRGGISLGLIKCHWDEPQFSFLGDPINCAARLQTAAIPGSVLVDEQISIAGAVREYEIKGARFRARSLDFIKDQVA